MKSKHILTLTLLIAIANIYHAKAQTKPLSIGMQMPDIKFSTTINFQTPDIKTSDFKGKLIIIDFWATWCSPCIAEIPKIQALQKKFKDSVVFLPVTYQDRTIVSPFVDKLFKNDKIKFNSILSDSVLNRMFPHASIPFFVWVDGSGKVIQTTDATQITASQIQQALHGSATATIRPMRNYRSFNPRQIVFPATIAYQNASSNENNLTEVLNPEETIFQSILTSYNPNLAGSLHYDSVHFVAMNVPIINLYRDYFGSWVYKKFPFIFWSAARCKVEIKDTSLYNKVTTDKHGLDYINWSKLNAYCYELNWNACKTWEEKFALLKSDLDRYFGDRLGIEAIIENRFVTSDVLIKINTNGILMESNDTAKMESDAFSYKQVGEPITAFINKLQGYYWQTSDRPVIDETGLKGKYDFLLQCDMNNLDEVNKSLLKYGLKFITANRLAEVLIIRKKKQEKPM